MTSDHRALIFVEKEDEANVYWTAEFGGEFVQKISSKFGREFNVRDLFTKLGKALTTGEKDVVIDWLTSEDLHNMARESSGAAVDGGDDDRVLVMLISSSEFMASIPFSLQKVTHNHAYSVASPMVSYLFRIIQRLKASSSPLANQEERHTNSKNPTVFLTGAETESSLSNKVKQLTEENLRLAKELRDLKQYPAVKSVDEKGSSMRELQALKNSLAEAEIEMSVIPALKKQLKDKIKEIEYLNLYAREVEICLKIRAPIPVYESYKALLEKRAGSPGPHHVAPESRQPPHGLAGKYMGKTSGPGFGGSLANKRAKTNMGNPHRVSERHVQQGPSYPTKELMSIYARPGAGRGIPGTSRTASQSRSTSKSKRDMPLLAKVTSTQKLPGYNIEYRNISGKTGVTPSAGPVRKPLTRHY